VSSSPPGEGSVAVPSPESFGLFSLEMAHFEFFDAHLRYSDVVMYMYLFQSSAAQRKAEYMYSI